MNAFGNTNAIIWLRDSEEKKFHGIYLHKGGEISHAGRILQKSYNTSESLQKLIELGDLKKISENLEECEVYSERMPLLEAEDLGEVISRRWTSIIYYKDGIQDLAVWQPFPGKKLSFQNCLLKDGLSFLDRTYQEVK